MIAVTGANGLLGSFIVRKLVEKNIPVAALVRKNSDRSLLRDIDHGITWHEADVLDFPSLTEAFENVSTVIHTAAMVSFNPRKAKQIFEVNVEGTRNVVDACLGRNVPKIIYISSVAALGRQKGMTIADEQTKWIESELNSDYGESKYLAELEMFRGKEEGIDVSMINPSVIVAPADWTKSSAQLFRYVWKERSFYTGGALNFVDVRDVVAMVMQLLETNFSGQRFIASAGGVPIKTFFDEIAKRFHKNAPSILVGNTAAAFVAWLEEIRCRLIGSEPLVTRQTAKLAKETFVYDNSKAKRELGIKFHSLEETLDWCCGEYLRKINTNN